MSESAAYPCDCPCHVKGSIGFFHCFTECCAQVDKLLYDSEEEQKAAISMKRQVFTSEGTYKVYPRGTAFMVSNPSECHNFDHLKGEFVEIDGKTYKVIGVEFFAHAAPWRKGEKIGLLVSNTLK